VNTTLERYGQQGRAAANALLCKNKQELQRLNVWLTRSIAREVNLDDKLAATTAFNQTFALYSTRTKATTSTTSTKPTTLKDKNV
jgi:hypothetical protein